VSLAQWRDLSIVLIALEVFAMLVAPLVAMALSVRGMAWVHQKLRGIFPRIQGYFAVAANATDVASQKIVRPIIAVSATSTQIRRWGPALFSSSSREV
jgi:hypothetical protein